MAKPAPLNDAVDLLDGLPRTPASSLKTLGWRGVMQAVREAGRVLVTNHDKPEAVIVSLEAYTAMARAVEDARRRDADVLDVLRTRFDERLAALDESDAGDRLRKVMDAPATLRGKVRAGASH